MKNIYEIFVNGRNTFDKASDVAMLKMCKFTIPKEDDTC